MTNTLLLSLTSLSSHNCLFKDVFKQSMVVHISNPQMMRQEDCCKLGIQSRATKQNLISKSKVGGGSVTFLATEIYVYPNLGLFSYAGDSSYLSICTHVPISGSNGFHNKKTFPQLFGGDT